MHRQEGGATHSMLRAAAPLLALLLRLGASKPVDPASWFACRPGSGPCNPLPKWTPTK